MNYTYDGQTYELYVVDDGTMDTVISVNGKEFRFDSEYARNEDGILEDTFTQAIEAYLDGIENGGDL